LLTSQLDRGDLRLEHRPVDVAEVVRATVDAMAPQVPDTLTIDLELSSELAPAAGDRDRLQQVLLNLLDNAVKYAARGSVKVRADTTNGTARIEVADDGPGIALADQNRIFEKFYRGDPELVRAPSGTGLGLYISRELVRRMGGSLGLASRPGAGATFTVELPLA
jgi:signal transduction histidine kinase